MSRAARFPYDCVCQPISYLVDAGNDNPAHRQSNKKPYRQRYTKR